MKLAIAGDVSITKYSRQAFEERNVETAFCDIPPIFKACDRVIVNLECALTDSENRISKFGPNLKAPKETADVLVDAGVTDCALSNNHIFDFGVEGVRDTLAELDRVGLKWTGFGKDLEDSKKNHTIVIDNVTVTVINVCEHEYTYATENRMGARPFDEFETMNDIRLAKKDADYVIVIYHGGKEHCRYPSPRLVKACREMVRCGADAVLCQHSHCIGCYERFEGGHILYGQGNFHFVSYFDNELWKTGLITLFDITKDSFDIDFIPTVENQIGIELAKGEEKKEILDAFFKRCEEMKSGAWRDGWKAFCRECDYYKDAFRKYDDTSDNARQLIAHYLDCEAHTDVIRELYPSWNFTNELDKQ